MVNESLTRPVRLGVIEVDILLLVRLGLEYVTTTPNPLNHTGPRPWVIYKCSQSVTVVVKDQGNRCPGVTSRLRITGHYRDSRIVPIRSPSWGGLGPPTLPVTSDVKEGVVPELFQRSSGGPRVPKSLGPPPRPKTSSTSTSSTCPFRVQIISCLNLSLLVRLL